MLLTATLEEVFFLMEGREKKKRNKRQNSNLRYYVTQIEGEEEDTDAERGP